MSEPKCTPGPWEVKINEYKREITIQTEWDNSKELSYLLSTTKIVLAKIYHGRDCTDLVEYEQAEANAHLIAAAPELYEALEFSQKALKANQPLNYCTNGKGERSPMLLEDPFRFARNDEAIDRAEAALAKARGEG